MKEALLAQVISGFFGLASMALGTYLPYRMQRRERDRTGRSDERSPDGQDAGELADPAPQPGTDR